MMMKRYSGISIILMIIGISLAVISVVLRFYFFQLDLPYYSVDENDIVEPALSYIAGDWEPTWYKYGPLFSYLLAIVFYIQKWIAHLLYGWSESDFFFKAFFDSWSFYYIARFFHFGIIIIISAVAYKFCRTNYDRKTAIVLLILCVAPLLDNVAQYTTRIDTLQGLFVLLSLYFAAKFNASEKYNKSYIFSGLFLGLAIATKPLTGLLVFPSLLVAHIFACKSDQRLQLTDIFSQLFLKNKGIYLLCASTLISHFLANPYSFINLQNFLLEQYNVIFNSALSNGIRPGYNFLWLFGKWGVLLALLAMCSPLILFLKRDRATVILVTYILTFVLAFLTFKTREYWYISIIPATIIIMARMIVVLHEYLANRSIPDFLKKTQTLYLVASVFVITPIVSLIFQYDFNSLTKRSDKAAQEWVESNIPSGSRIFTVGKYSSTLPRLRSEGHKSNAMWAEYFMYGRHNNKKWVDKYLVAYDRMMKSGLPRYQIINIKKEYHANYNSKEMLGDVKINELFNKHLHEAAKINNAQFVITASWFAFHGDWEDEPGVRLLQEFNINKGYRGAYVKIFQVE